MSVQQCYYCNNPIGAADAQFCPSCSQPLVFQGKYRILKVLGQGGFGIVYEAIDTRLNRHCAIKVLTSASISQQQSVEAEAGILAQYASQFAFIPHIYDIWGERSQTYFVMEYIDGPSLDELLEKPWPAAQVEDFLRTLLGYLSQIHSAGIIHRDLKPANIKRTSKGRYVLLDFGIAKQGGGATMTGARALSMDYSPPEQWRGIPTDARSDLFSLAATAYQLLTCKTPTRADIRLTAATPVTPPSQLVPNVPSPLERVLMRMLEVEPDNRPASAQDALKLLDTPSGQHVAPANPAPVASPRNDETRVAGNVYSPPPPGGYAPPPPGGGYPPQPGGYAQSPPGGGYAQPPPGGGYAQPPPGGGYAPPPPGGGYPPQPGGYSQPKPFAQTGAKRPWWMFAIPVVALVLALGGFLIVQGNSRANANRTATAQSQAQRQGTSRARTDTAKALIAEETAIAEANETATAEAEEQAATETAEAEEQAAISATETALAIIDNGGGDIFDTAVNWPLALYEEFNDNQSSWFTGDADNEFLEGNRSVIDGVYRWEIRTKKGVTWQAPGPTQLSNTFFYNTTVQRVEGPENAGYGVMFLQPSDGASRYRFMISDVGSFLVDRLSDGEWTTLVKWTTTDAIRPGEPNDLTVIGEEGHFIFYINYVQVTEIDDDELTSGYFGPVVEMYDEGTEAVFIFDDLHLRGFK